MAINGLKWIGIGTESEIRVNPYTDQTFRRSGGLIEAPLKPLSTILL